MQKNFEFSKAIEDSYSFEGESIAIGAAMFEKDVMRNRSVTLPLSTLHKHGLISGASGTGKTRTVQLIAEKLSEQRVPTLIIDRKADHSGMAKPGERHSKTDERHKKIGEEFVPKSFPVELLSFSEEGDMNPKFAISEFGALFFSELLGLSDKGADAVSMILEFAEKKKLKLIDLEGFKEVLKQITDGGKKQKEFEEMYEALSPDVVKRISEKVDRAESESIDMLFGKPVFDVADLLKSEKKKDATVSVLQSGKLSGNERTISIAILALLSEIIQKFPEKKQIEKPSLVILIEEAQLIFSDLDTALIEQIKTMIKPLSLRGVGIIFTTEEPTDIPTDILDKLGLRVHHALRSFTAKDRRSIKLLSESYSENEYYNVEKLITELGIGEALVTALNEEGQHTLLVHTMLEAPRSRMGGLSH